MNANVYLTLPRRVAALKVRSLADFNPSNKAAHSGFEGAVWLAAEIITIVDTDSNSLLTAF